MNKPNFAAMNPAVAKAIEQMLAEQGDKFSLEKINLAELERRTGISRAKLRRMKEHNIEDTEHALKGRKAATTLLRGYTGILLPPGAGYSTGYPHPAVRPCGCKAG